VNGEWSEPQALRVTPHHSTSSVVGNAIAVVCLLVACAAAVAGETEWQQLQQQAQAAFDRRDFARSERLAREALLEADASLGAYHHATEESLNLLSLALRMRKEPREALPFAQRLVAVRMRRYGARDAQTAIALHNTAEILIALGDLDAAERVQREAVEIFTVKLGPNHFNTAAGLHNLGAIRLKQKRYAEAELYLRQALTAKEHVLQPESLSIALTLDNLAVALESQGKHDEALKVKRRADAIRGAAARGQAPR